MDFINNTWFVGIAGGILSGLAVNYLSKYFISQKDSKEYAEKVSSANREVIFALRQCIPNGHIPEPNVLTAMINSTCRKYQVSRNDVYGSIQLSEDLIKEIMDSSFISDETKKNHCNSLIELTKADLNEITTKDANSTIHYLNRNKQIAFLSRVLGLLAAIIISSTAIFTSINNAIDNGNYHAEITFINSTYPIYLVALIIVVGTFLCFFLISKIRKKYRRKLFIWDI